MNLPTGFNVAGFALSRMQEPLNGFLNFSRRELVCVLLISVSAGGWGRRVWGCLLVDITPNHVFTTSSVSD